LQGALDFRRNARSGAAQTRNARKFDRYSKSYCATNLHHNNPIEGIMGKVTNFLYNRFTEFSGSKMKTLKQNLENCDLDVSDISDRVSDRLPGAVVIKDLSQNIHSRYASEKINYIATGNSDGFHYHVEDHLFDSIKNKFGGTKIAFPAKVIFYIPYSPCTGCAAHLLDHCNEIRDNCSQNGDIYFRFIYDTMYTRENVPGGGQAWNNYKEAKDGLDLINTTGGAMVNLPSGKSVPYLTILHWRRTSLKNL
jgi:hypothetical protein